jgi:peptidoglycan/LPS O-acetylase OafA/YrhL
MTIRHAATRRARLALVCGLAALLTLPAAIELASRSKRIALLDAAYAIPLAFLLAVFSLGMAQRSRRNLRWLQLREQGTGVATAAVVVGTIALCLSLVAALSVGFYGLVVIYQHSR